MNRVVITHPELNYYTRVINNYENVEFDELLDENEAQLIINNSVVDFAKRTNGGLINLPENRNLALMTDLDMNGKSYANKLLINVSGITTGTDLPVLNPQTTSITQNGTYTLADTDSNPQDIEIERVQQRKVLNIVEKSNDNLRDDTISLGTFTVNVPQDLNVQIKKTVNIDENGNYVYSADENYDVIKDIEVNVNVPQYSEDIKVQDTKQVTLWTNGTEEILPNSGYDAMSKVVVSAFVDNQTTTKNITSNGEYNAWEEEYEGDPPYTRYIGYSKVNVNIPILQNKSAQIMTDENDYKNEDVKTGRVIINKDSLPPENYQGVYKTQTTNYLIPLNVNNNGTYLIYGDSNKTPMDIGYWKVDVNVPIKEDRSMPINIGNGWFRDKAPSTVEYTRDIVVPSGYVGQGAIHMNFEMLYKSITENGSYNIINYRQNEHEVGWYQVDVNIPMQNIKYVSATIPDDYYINHADENGNIRYNFEVIPNTNYTAMKKTNAEILLLNKTITESGTYTIYENRAQENRLGWWKVDVNIPILQNKSAQIMTDQYDYENPDSETGRVVINQDFLPPENYKGVYKTQTTNYLIPLDVTENGTYTIYRDSNKTPMDIGYWKVNVNVPRGDTINNANVNGNGIIVSNGQYSIPSGYTGFNGFNVSVPIKENREVYYDLANNEYPNDNSNMFKRLVYTVPEGYEGQKDLTVTNELLYKKITSNGVYDITQENRYLYQTGYWKVDVEIPLMDNLSAQVLTDTSDYMNPDESDGRVAIIKTFNPPSTYTAAKEATTVNTLLTLNATDNRTYYIYNDERKAQMDIGYWRVNVDIPMLDVFTYSITTETAFDYIYKMIPDDEFDRVQIQRYIKPPELYKAFKEVDTNNYLLTLECDHNGTYYIYSDENKSPMDIGYWRVTVNVPENRNVKTIITKPQINNIYLKGVEYEVNEKEYERIEGIKIINNCVNSLISVFKYNSKGKWEINMYYIDENANNIFIGEENCVSYYKIYETKQKLENINYAILRNDKEEILYNPLILDINSNIYNNPYPTIIGESIELPFNLLL